MIDRNKEKQSVLIVDDTPANVEFAVNALSNIPIELFVANNGHAALSILEHEKPSLILLDILMPGIDGFETCRRIRQTSQTSDIPIIFLTANKDDVVKGFEYGANDYIAKPYKVDELLVRVNHQLERLRLIDDLKTLNENLELKVRERTVQLIESNRNLRLEINERRYMQDRLQYLSERDFVSGVYNRATIEKRLAFVIDKHRCDDVQTIFIAFDLLNFKLVNETCGYIAGDRLLCELGELLNLYFDECVLGKLAGAKFGVLFEGPLEQAKAISDKVISTLINKRFHHENRSFTLSGLISLIIIDSDFESVEQVLLASDFLLNQAKQDGAENRVIEGQEKVKTAISPYQQNIANRLIDAIEGSEIDVYFQSQNALLDRTNNQEQIKIELLARIRDERGDLVSPALFIPIAEKFTLVTFIDKFVYEEACRFIQDNQAKLDKVASINVNLSALTIRQEGITDFFISTARAYSIPPEKIEFEITESQSISNVEATIAFMQTLRKEGFRFALDDFGTGFASYSHLQSLPFSTIKIDPIFVRNIQNNKTNLALIKSIIQFAKTLNMEVVAEYVESPSIAELLQELGCNWAQGYAFHAPEELTERNLSKQIDLYLNA